MNAAVFYGDALSLASLPFSPALPPRRAALYRSYRREEDRLLCLAGWHIMTRVLGNQGHLDEERIHTGPHGKPYLRGGPFFNLSHSGRYVLLGVADTEIGVDMEKRHDADYAALARASFHPDELAVLLRNCDSDTFFAYWTAKESYLKYLGSGLSRNPASFCVTFKDNNAGIAENPDLFLRVYTEIPGYSAAVCSMCSPPARLMPVSLL